MDLRRYKQVKDAGRAIDLAQFESGICLIRPWCPDSLRMAKLLAGHSIKVRYFDESMEHVYEEGKFKPLGATNILAKDYGYVPVLFLRRQGQLYGTWTTHHGTAFNTMRF